MKIFSFFLICLGLLSLFFNISHPPGMSGKDIQYYNSVENRLLSSSIYLILGWVFYYFSRNKSENKKEFSKCPKCKEVFNYKELKEGKCKYCEDIETIEIEEYYKKLSKENENDK